MILTVLEAHVAPERTEDLKKAYTSAGQLPPGLVSTSLLQDAADPTLWHIQTFWESREAIEAMRSKGTPGGVLMFRAAGTEPTLKLFSVVATLD